MKWQDVVDEIAELERQVFNSDPSMLYFFEMFPPEWPGCIDEGGALCEFTDIGVMREVSTGQECICISIDCAYPLTPAAVEMLELMKGGGG